MWAWDGRRGTGNVMDLTTLGALKTRLKIAASNTAADDELSALITQTSADFCNATNRQSFFTTDYSEQRDGQGGQVLVLRNQPVQSVSGVAIGVYTIFPSADGVQPGYVFDANSIKLIGYIFARGYGNVRVQYAAGLGSALSDPAFPPEIELAVLDWCQYRYKVQPAAAVASKHLHTGEQVSYDIEDMPKTTKRVVEQYKRRVAVL
jgi:hypothetical protein